MGGSSMGGLPIRHFSRSFQERLLQCSLKFLDECLIRRPPFRKENLGSSRFLGVYFGHDPTGFGFVQKRRDRRCNFRKAGKPWRNQ